MWRSHRRLTNLLCSGKSTWHRQNNLTITQYLNFSLTVKEFNWPSQVGISGCQVPLLVQTTVSSPVRVNPLPQNTVTVCPISYQSWPGVFLPSSTLNGTHPVTKCIFEKNKIIIKAPHFLSYMVGDCQPPIDLSCNKFTIICLSESLLYINISAKWWWRIMMKLNYWMILNDLLDNEL